MKSINEKIFRAAIALSVLVGPALAQSTVNGAVTDITTATASPPQSLGTAPPPVWVRR